MNLRVNVENSLVSLSPRINADLDLVPTGYSQVCVFGETDRFPSVEIYHDLPGSIRTLLQREQSSLGVLALAGPVPNFRLPPCETSDVPLGPAAPGGVFV